MGKMIDGVWHAEDPLLGDDSGDSDERDGGAFERQETTFRNWVTEDGEPGPSGEDGFKAEPGRYHLYVCYACPWAHRALVMRELKGLTDVISLSSVHWYMGDNGWTFQEADGVIPDPVIGADYLHQIYKHADDNFTGRVTVPVLWDLKRGTIVSNESAEIIRMLNSAFNAFAERPELDFYPEPKRSEIDEVNERVYHTVNNGVYRAGFATSQEAYEDAASALFETLDWLEDRLSRQRYLVGDQLTEADWRLFTTLLRFDPVYHGHFKCNIRRLVDYPNLWDYTRELFQVPGVDETVRLDFIKKHYYASHESVNPTGIVPVGPAIDFTIPHNRDSMKGAA